MLNPHQSWLRRCHAQQAQAVAVRDLLLQGPPHGWARSQLHVRRCHAQQAQAVAVRDLLLQGPPHGWARSQLQLRSL